MDGCTPVTRATSARPGVEESQRAMSIQNVTAFIQKVGDDAELYAAIKQLPAGSFEHLQRTASANGFAFSEQDWREVTAKVTGPLDDQALDAVAGGAYYASAYQSSYAVQMPLALTSFTRFGGVLAACGAG